MNFKMKPYDFQPGEKVFFVKWRKKKAKIFKGIMFIKALDEIKDEKGQTMQVCKCVIDLPGGIMVTIYDINLYLDTDSEMNRVRGMIKEVEDSS